MLTIDGGTPPPLKNTVAIVLAPVIRTVPFCKPVDGTARSTRVAVGVMSTKPSAIVSRPLMKRCSIPAATSESMRKLSRRNEAAPETAEASDTSAQTSEAETPVAEDVPESTAPAAAEKVSDTSAQTPEAETTGADEVFDPGAEYYSQAKMTASIPGSRAGNLVATYWRGNFFPDMGAWDQLAALPTRGAGGKASPRRRIEHGPERVVDERQDVRRAHRQDDVQRPTDRPRAMQRIRSARCVKASCFATAGELSIAARVASRRSSNL